MHSKQQRPNRSPTNARKKCEFHLLPLPLHPADDVCVCRVAVALARHSKFKNYSAGDLKLYLFTNSLFAMKSVDGASHFLLRLLDAAAVVAVPVTGTLVHLLVFRWSSRLFFSARLASAAFFPIFI